MILHFFYYYLLAIYRIALFHYCNHIYIIFITIIYITLIFVTGINISINIFLLLFFSYYSFPYFSYHCCIFSIIINICNSIVIYIMFNIISHRAEILVIFAVRADINQMSKVSQQHPFLGT